MKSRNPLKGLSKSIWQQLKGFYRESSEKMEISRGNTRRIRLIKASNSRIFKRS
jgi:hypothetical protein